MQFQYLNKIVKNRISLLPFVVFSGIIYSFIIVFLFMKLTATYATFCAAMLIFPFVILIFGDSKRLLWTILIICLPVTIDTTINYNYAHIGGAAGYMISLFDVVLVALYFLWLIEIVSKKSPRFNLFLAITIPFIFFLFTALLSMLGASYPDFCKFEIVEVIKMYLGFLYLANNIKTKNDVQFIISVFILILFFEGILGIAQHHYGEPFFPSILGGPDWIGSRVQGTWKNYNDFSWYLTFFLPLSMSLLFSEIKPVYKIICFFALLTGAGSLIWTNSRAGWISVVSAGLFVCLFVFCKIKGKKNLINVVVSLIVVVVLLFPLYPKLYSKMYGRFTGDDKGSAESRFILMRVALNIIKANPFIGIGINNYTEVMDDYDNTIESVYEYSRYPVHNIYLHITSEMGILGLIGFTWILISLYFNAINYIILSKGIMVYAVIGMLSGIFAFLVHGLVDTASIGSKMFHFLWFFAGIIFAIHNIETE